MQGGLAILTMENGLKAAKAVKEPLQVRIPGAVKRRFKALAALRGIEPNELFVEVWEHYERAHTDASSGQGR
jgi:hypothetical protein